MKFSLSSRRGFTLIELLVVLAIIGILSAVVLASLNNSRAKSRDAKRIADIKQLQLNLELYADLNGGVYPTTLAGLVSSSIVSQVPVDPVTGNQYTYIGLSDTALGACVGYHLGADLEYRNQAHLDTDADAAAFASPFTNRCVANTNDFTGAVNDPTKCDGSSGGYCYDVRP